MPKNTAASFKTSCKPFQIAALCSFLTDMAFERMYEMLDWHMGVLSKDTILHATVIQEIPRQSSI